jgi:hypothetical protein
MYKQFEKEKKKMNEEVDRPLLLNVSASMQYNIVLLSSFTKENDEQMFAIILLGYIRSIDTFIEGYINIVIVLLSN